MILISKLKHFGYILGFGLMILGAAFISMPERIVGIMTVLTGAILLLYGLFRTIFVIFRWNNAKNRVLLLILGLALMAAGSYFLLNTLATVRITGMVLGILAILLAFDRFAAAHKMHGQVNILPAVITGLIHLAFGTVLFYSSLKMFAFIIILCGIYLFASGVMVVLSLRLFNDF